MAAWGELQSHDMVSLFLPWASLKTWRTLARTNKAEYATVFPLHQQVVRRAMAPDATVSKLSTDGRAAAYRIWAFSGVSVEDASVPVLVEQIHDWAKNGRRLNGKPVKRLEHLSRIRNEFDGTSAESGIKASMRNELVAVKEVLQLKLTLNGLMSEVDLLQLVPYDVCGKLAVGQSVPCSRARPKTEATALMWATRHGVRWVEMMLGFSPDVQQVTPGGWSALLYAAAFESRKVVTDGASDCSEGYGGYRHRSRGVVGPLIDAGAALDRNLPLRTFLDSFAPSPIFSEKVGPQDLARTEAASREGWAAVLLSV